MDATLGELAELVQEVSEPAQRPRARISFAFVYPDRRGANVMRQVGVVTVGRPGGDDDPALSELGFQTGDMLDVAVLQWG
jgi:histone deacetylase complex subunit SAP18